MTAPKHVTYAGELYDRTLGLFTGQVQMPGVALRYLALPVEEVFWRQSRHREFDASEYSLGSYLSTFERGSASDLIGLPIFPSRAFRHGAIYVRADRGIEGPRDLEGRAVGTPEWTQTASLWVRGLLADRYGVDLRSVGWRLGGLHEPGREEKTEVSPPASFEVRRIDDDQTLDGLLLGGDLDAVVSARPPRSFSSGNPLVRRLFPDYRQVEADYFRETGIFPIMHLVVLRAEVRDATPWLPGSLLRGFEHSRVLAIERLRDSTTQVSSLAWTAAYAEEELAVLGDAFAHGVSGARVALDTFLRYAQDQGITARRLDVDELFCPSTYSMERV
ncbi:MAG: 4,5-dihydroxyphthalate decarboxylase [Micromonosporaceae bacterium]|nr:4,5-dihydroxyphthalate decarboxylase [Micromonosporaceae bacterium]